MLACGFLESFRMLPTIVPMDGYVVVRAKTVEGSQRRTERLVAPATVSPEI